MRRLRRLRAFFTGHFREAFAPAPEPTPPPSESTTTDREDRESPLPPGWHFAALYYNAGGRMVTNSDPTDDEIAGADAIIVRYTDALGSDYRTIHGARDRKQIGTLITFVTIPASPPR